MPRRTSTAGAPENLSPETRTITDRASGLMGLSPDEAQCLAVRLEQNPDLRNALGNDPATSPRNHELADLAQTCMRVTTGAVNFANGIASTNPQLTDQQLICLRDSYAELPQAAVQELVQAALDPTTPNPNAKTTYDRLMDTCDIDTTSLTGTPIPSD